MANTFTDPVHVKAKPHASPEKQVGHADPSGRADVINRPSKGYLANWKRLINALFDGLTVDFTDQTTTTAFDVSKLTAAKPAPVRWLLQGNAAVGVNQSRVLIDRSATIEKVIVKVNTAPTGADLTLDINKNGVTIWTTQANRVKVLATQTTGSTTTFDVTGLVEGDELSLDVDIVGSSVPGGNDLMVTVILKAAP